MAAKKKVVQPAVDEEPEKVLEPGPIEADKATMRLEPLVGEAKPKKKSALTIVTLCVMAVLLALNSITLVMLLQFKSLYIEVNNLSKGYIDGKYTSLTADLNSTKYDIRDTDYYTKHTLDITSKSELLFGTEEDAYMIIFWQDNCSHCETALGYAVDFYNRTGDNAKLQIYFLNIHAKDAYETMFDGTFDSSLSSSNGTVEDIVVEGTPTIMLYEYGYWAVYSGSDTIMSILEFYLDK